MTKLRLCLEDIISTENLVMDTETDTFQFASPSELSFECHRDQHPPLQLY